jgi:hypothetical protein
MDECHLGYRDAMTGDWIKMKSTRWTRICRARLACPCGYTSTGTITASTTALTTCTYRPPCLASVGNGSGRPENTY